MISMLGCAFTFGSVSFQVLHSLRKVRLFSIGSAMIAAECKAMLADLPASVALSFVKGITLFSIIETSASWSRSCDDKSAVDDYLIEAR